MYVYIYIYIYIYTYIIYRSGEPEVRLWWLRVGV